MKKLISFIIAAVLLTLSFAVSASAVAVEEDTAYLESNDDIVFGVEWDVARPTTLVFIDPYGTEYDTAKQGSNTTTVVNGNTLYYTIMNASAGQWRIRYDKGSNTLLEVTVYNYNPGISIDYFNIGTVEGDYLPVAFCVSGDEDVWYNWRISAVVDHQGIEKELASNTWGSYTGSEITRSLYLRDLATYSSYMLKLYVWYNDGEADIFDVAFSDKFAYTNTTVDNYTFDYKITVRPETQTVTVDWQGLSWSAQSVLVALFEDGSDEPIVFDEFDPDDANSVDLGYDPSVSKVSVEVAVKFNDLYTTPRRTELNVASFGIELPDAKAFNTTLVPLNYKGFSQQLVSMSINGYVTEHQLKGDGSLNLTLGDDWNNVVISFTDTANVNWIIERDIFVDRIAPILNISRAYDGMVIAGEKVTISGTVSDCAKLTVNGNELEIGSDNGFVTELALQEGANTVTIVAADALGNETQYTASITRKSADGETDNVAVSGDEAAAEPAGSFYDTITDDNSFWILGGVSVLCLIVIVYALIFWKKKGKEKQPKSKKSKKGSEGADK